MAAKKTSKSVPGKPNKNEIACLKAIKEALEKHGCELNIKPYPVNFVTKDGPVPQTIDIQSKQ